MVDTQAVVSAVANKDSAVPVMSDAGVIAVKKDFFSTQRDNMKGQYSFPGIKLPFPQNCGAFFYINTQEAFFRHPGNDTPELFQKYLNKHKAVHLAGEVQFFRQNQKVMQLFYGGHFNFLSSINNTFIIYCHDDKIQVFFNCEIFFPVAVCRNSSHGTQRATHSFSAYIPRRQQVGPRFCRGRLV
jgi:hypothetical protein